MVFLCKISSLQIRDFFVFKVLMEKYTKIVEYLNSSDPETIIIGLQYLKESNIEISKKVFKEEEYVRKRCDEIINYITSDNNHWAYLLDCVIYKIMYYSPAFIACNFFEYKFKVVETVNSN